MKKTIIFTLFFSLILFSNAIFAQLKSNTAFVKGHLIDTKSKSVIPYAVIRIINTGKYVMTDVNGDFELEIPKKNWRQKEIKLEIIADNYETKVLEFETKKHKASKVFLIRLKRIKMVKKT